MDRAPCIVPVAQVVFGHSWPIEAMFGAGHEGSWFWNDSAQWMVNVSRIWCLVFVLDTLWSWGGVLLAKSMKA